MTNKDTQDGKILTATYTLDGWQLSMLVPVLKKMGIQVLPGWFNPVWGHKKI